MNEPDLLAQTLFMAGSLPFLVLGTIHLLYTFFTDKFSSKNEEAVNAMKVANPKLTRETTMWKAWLGFNASHSSGAIFIGAMNLYLGLFQFKLIQESQFLLPFILVTSGFYLWLARRYWFRIPLIGILVSFASYSIACLLIWIG